MLFPYDPEHDVALQPGDISVQQNKNETNKSSPK